MASVEYQYSVQVKSRFELLGRDDLNVEDPDLYLKKIQARKSEPKPAVSAGKDKAAAKSAVVSKKSAAPVRKDSRENADQAESQVETRASNAVDDQQVLRSESWEARGRGRGGFTRSRPVAGSGQRQFDRHSGSDKTGVKPVMKKDGHGTGNWGSIDDVIEMATDPEVTIDEHLIDAGPEEPVAELVEEVKTLTLKEYKSQQKATKPAIQLSTKASREANDGKDVFNNMIPSHKPKPVQQQVADLFEEDENKKQDEPVFFDFNRDKPPTNRGRGRTSGPNLFGRNQAHANTDPNEQNGENLEQSERSPNWSMRGGPRRGGGEFGRGGRGRGAFDPERVGKGRGGFDSERGAGHGRGSFDPERGGRGRGAFGSERGAGRGRGNFDQEHSGRGRGGYDVERGGRGRGRGRGSYDPERGSHARGGYDPDRGSHGRGGYDPERGSHGRGGYDPERGSHARGGFDSERGNRGRSNFNSERGSRGRGGFDSERGNRSRGGFDSERGRRGHGGHEHEGDNAQVSLSNERGGSRGGRGRGFGTSEDGQGSSQRGRGSGFDRGRGFGGRERGFRGAGGFRNGRGTFEPNEPEIKSDVAPAAPAMDSEEDFPVLK